MNTCAYFVSRQTVAHLVDQKSGAKKFATKSQKKAIQKTMVDNFLRILTMTLPKDLWDQKFFQQKTKSGKRDCFPPTQRKFVVTRS